MKKHKKVFIGYMPETLFDYIDWVPELYRIRGKLISSDKDKVIYMPQKRIYNKRINRDWKKVKLTIQEIK